MGRGFTPSRWDAERAAHWSRFGPPARPSPGEVAAYARLLAGARGPRWALFGATPELRSLAARAGQRLVCIDRDAAVVAALGRLREAAGEETLWEGDWLDADPGGAFDVLLGDGALNMLPGDRHAAFLARLHALARPGALVLLRVHLAEPPRFPDPHAVFAWRRAEAPDVPVFTATRTHLDMLWLEPDTLRLSLPEVHRRVRALHAEGAIDDAELDGYARLARFDGIDVHYTTRARLEALLGDRFRVEAEADGGDYPGSAQHPVFALRAC